MSDQNPNQQSQEFPKNKPLLAELWDFLKTRKKWWLLPILILSVLLGALILLSQGSAISPFIYTIF